MFGIENEDELPDPAIHMKEFIRAVDRRLLGERKQWNPIKKVSNHCFFPSSIRLFMPIFLLLQENDALDKH